MQIKTNGVTRLVFVFSTFVIKVPKPRHWRNFLRGLIGNINEGDTWKWNSGKYEKGTSHLLCPVIWSMWGGWLLIMKRAEPITTKQEGEVFRQDDWALFKGDDSLSNYGLLDGVCVKIDYADLDLHWGEDFKPKGKEV